MADADDKPQDPRSKIIGYYFDAVKTIGTGNSAGLFGAGVALYYFAMRDAQTLWWIKVAMFVYLGGVCCFAMAYLALTLFAVLHVREKSSWCRGKVSLAAAIFFGVFGLLAWWAGTFVAGYVVTRL